MPFVSVQQQQEPLLRLWRSLPQLVLVTAQVRQTATSAFCHLPNMRARCIISSALDMLTWCMFDSTCIHIYAEDCVNALRHSVLKRSGSKRPI